MMRKDFSAKRLLHFAFKTSTMAVAITGSVAAHANASVEWTFEVLHTFAGTDGECPVGPLVRGQDGFWYGATREGGRFGGGTVFRLKGDGSVKTLHHFNPKNESSRPSALTVGADGMFYGATGGNYQSASAIVYRIDSAGTLQTIHRFDPYEGSSRVTFGSDGALYGNGGGSGPWALGAVYRLTLNGDLTTLYLMGRTATAPYYGMGSLALGTDGWLYGAANRGGDHDMGAIYRVMPNGTSEVVYSFHAYWDEVDGKTPQDGPIAGPDGSVYGTTPSGAGAGGTLWKLDPNGVFSTLHKLPVDGAEGYAPIGGDALRKHGALVGATSSGGAEQQGTVYRFDPSGHMRILHSFASSQLEGSGFKDTTAIGKNGEIVGTACGGGSGHGTIYRLKPQY